MESTVQRHASASNLGAHFARSGTDWACRKRNLRTCVAWMETYVGGIERGERNPALVNIKKIAVKIPSFRRWKRSS
jgi:hypothetical protein